jgi:hypothetical protein
MTRLLRKRRAGSRSCACPKNDARCLRLFLPCRLAAAGVGVRQAPEPDASPTATCVMHIIRIRPI